MMMMMIMMMMMMATKEAAKSEMGAQTAIVEALAHLAVTVFQECISHRILHTEGGYRRQECRFCHMLGFVKQASSIISFSEATQGAIADSNNNTFQ